MSGQLFKLIFLSIKRRWRQIARAFMAAFFAVFFITSVLIFEENMFEWQVASNKARFGNWFIMETNREKQNEQFMNHSTVSSYATAMSAVKMYDSDFDFTGSTLGYMPPEFMKIGHIEPAQGRMPEKDNEIAIDWNTFIKLGITNPEVGQIITINYYDNNNRSDENKKTEEFVLVGILEDYTNIWRKGSELPGAIVTKERYDAFGCRYSSVHIYQLASDIREADYHAIYQDMISGTNLKPVYNSYVYDYEAWGDKSVYNYMYLLVMVIGIAALTYQLIVYKNSRKNTYRLMRNLGASKAQIMLTTFIENVIILLPSGFIGIGASALVGRIVCLVIENQMGIAFYYLNTEIFAKSLMAVLVAVVVEELASRLLTVREVLSPKKAAKTKGISAKSVKAVSNEAESKAVVSSKDTLKPKNVLRKISFRFTRANRLAQNLGLRIFSLAICVVIIICSYNIYSAYMLYDKNKDNLDLLGNVYQDKKYEMKLPYYGYIGIKDGRYNFDDYNAMVGVDKINGQITPAKEEFDMLFSEANSGNNIVKLSDDKALVVRKSIIEKGKYCEQQDANVTIGFNSAVTNIIENLTGVEEVSYSTYENQRVWTWDGMSLNEMGYGRLNQRVDALVANVQPYASRYLFATEYVNPTREMYDRISKYMEPDMVDYEAFCKGEQVLVLLADNPYGEYDSTLKTGTTINYHYYDLIFGRYNINEDLEHQNIFSFDEPYYRFTEGKLYEKVKNSKGLWEIRIKFDNLQQALKYGRIQTSIELKPCVQTKAAGVVHLTEEVQEEFKDLISNYGYYTAIASNTLAENACEKQNEIMAEMAGISVNELPDDCKAHVVYNKLYVKYNLMASICATDNILSTYCEENNIDCVSFADVNEQYRTNLINAYLRYGITIAAAIVINMLISAIIAQNRLEARKQRIELLLRIGAERKGVRKIFMIEALRESLWCIFTMPLILIIQYIIYTRNIKRI